MVYFFIQKFSNFDSMDESDLFVKKVGAKIKHLRKEHGLSQVALSYDLDLSKQSICNIEAGKKNLTLKTILKISKALGTKPSELLEV
jgi:DNA-binding XRE family transcriptional regulator